MRSATAAGCEYIDRMAARHRDNCRARPDISRWADGGIIWSSVVPRYQLGLLPRRIANRAAQGLNAQGLVSRRGLVRDDQHVDREVLRCPTFRRRAADDLCERRAELFLQEALEGLARLPDVVNVVTLLAMAGAVQDQPLRRLVFPHRRGMPKHLLGDVIVELLRELRRCRQDSNRHLASS